MNKILLINGPNLNYLGIRQPEIYGHTTLQQVEASVEQVILTSNFKLTTFQSNHEGALIDFIQNHLDAKGIIINPGGLTHNSYALLDALLIKQVLFVEVHISNVYARGIERQHSVFSKHAACCIIGAGVFGYQLAAHYLINKLSVNY